MTLRMRVLPRFPATIDATNGLEVVRLDGSPDLLIRPDFSSLIQIPSVSNPDDVFFIAWDRDLDAYRIMSFDDLFSGVADLGFMTVAMYDPQGKHADAFARANHTGTQAQSTITNLTADLVTLTAAAAAKLPLAGGAMTGPIDLAGNSLKNAGAGVADYIKGLITSKSSAYVVSVAAGSIKGNGRFVTNAGAFTKNLNAVWAAGSGNGGRDTAAAITANTTYHLFALSKDSDGSIDFIFSLSATAPTVPSGYTLVGRVWSVYTNATPNGIFDYTQDGNKCYVANAVHGTVSATAPFTVAAIPASIPCPAGISVEMFCSLVITVLGGSSSVSGQYLDAADTGGVANSGVLCSSSAGAVSARGKVRTNTSRGVGSALVVTGTATMQFNLGGWEDYTLNRIY